MDIIRKPHWVTWHLWWPPPQPWTLPPVLRSLCFFPSQIWLVSPSQLSLNLLLTSWTCLCFSLSLTLILSFPSLRSVVPLSELNLFFTRSKTADNQSNHLSWCSSFIFVDHALLLLNEEFLSLSAWCWLEVGSFGLCYALDEQPVDGNSALWFRTARLNWITCRLATIVFIYRFCIPL